MSTLTVKTRDWTPPWPLDLPATVGLHRRGSGDPAFRIERDAVVRASHTPDGPGTLRLSREGGRLHALTGDVHAQAWGPGADWLLATLPEFLGSLDDPDALAPGDPVIDGLARRARGMRIGSTGRVWEALVPAILEQKVVCGEAWRSWRHLVKRHGEPAPGVDALWVPPPRERWLDIPNWEWHRAGAEPVRMRTIRAAATVDVERHADKLTVLRGVGEWTQAEVRARACGDADAVPVGDFHLPNVVGHALAGERVDDAAMLDLLEPFAGQRYRVIRLITGYGRWPQRRGARMSVRDYRAI